MSDDVREAAVNDFVNQGQGDSETPEVSESTTSPAEVQNTDTSAEVNLEGQKIPYSRFKEVNDTKKELEARVKEYEDKLKGFEGYTAETLSVYKDFDNFVSSIPNGSEELSKWIEKMSGQINGKSETPKVSKDIEEEEDYEDSSVKENKKLQERLDRLEKAYQKEKFESIVQGYENVYKTLTEGKNYSQEENDIIQRYITKHLVETNKNYMAKVDIDGVKEGYKKAEQVLNKLKSGGEEVVEEDVDQPVNEGGIPGILGVDMKDKDAREKFLQDGFRNIKL
jgi:hypothetical protein